MMRQTYQVPVMFLLFTDQTDVIRTSDVDLWNPVMPEQIFDIDGLGL